MEFLRSLDDSDRRTPLILAKRTENGQIEDGFQVGGEEMERVTEESNQSHAEADAVQEITSAERVRFQFMKFIEVDRLGNEIERRPSFGYILFNDERKDYGYGTFGASDSYTIHYDVLNQIRVKHPEFMSYITESGGFYLGDSWIPVENDGDLETH